MTTTKTEPEVWDKRCEDGHLMEFSFPPNKEGKVHLSEITVNHVLCPQCQVWVSQTTLAIYDLADADGYVRLEKEYDGE